MSDLPNLSGKVGLDVTDFKAGISELNRSIRVIESGFRATAAGLGDWAKSTTGLETRIKSLNSEIGLQKTKVSALREEYERVAKEKGENSRAAQDLEIRLNKETETLNKMEGELGAAEQALTEMAKESDKAADGAGELAESEKEAEKETGRLETALGGLKEKLKGLGSDFKELGDKVLKGVAVGLASVGTAVAGAVAGIGTLVLKTAAMADDIVESAEKLGISAEQYQEFSFVADQIGTDVESIGRAFARTTKAIASAIKEGDPMADVFKNLGVSVVDANGALRSTQDVFGDLIDSLGKIENETQRDILAQELFGKSYQELVPLINLGSEGLAELTEQAREMGAVMSEDGVNAAADLNDKIGALKAGFKGLISRLAGAFMPLVTKIVDKMQEWLADPKIQEGIARLVEGIGNFATVIGNVLDKLLTGDVKGALLEIFPAEVVDKIMGFAKAINDLIQETIIPFVKKHAKAIKGAIIGIGAVLAGAGIVSLIASIANPITLIVAAVGLLAAAWAEDWGGIRTSLTEWWNTTGKPIFDQLVTWLQVNIPIAIQTLSDFWTNTLQPALQTFWEWIQTTVFPIIQTLWDWLATNVPIAIQTLSDFWTNTLQPALKTFWEWVETYVFPIISWLVDHYFANMGAGIQLLSDLWTNTLQPALQTFWEWIQTTVFPIIQTLWDWLATNVPAAIQTLSDFWTNKLLPAIKDVWDFFTTSILPIFQDVIDIVTKLGEIALTALAGFWENVLQPALEKVWGYLNENIMPIFTTIKDFIVNKLGPAVQWLADNVFAPLGETIMGGVKDALEWVHDQLVKLKEFLDNFELPDWLTPGSPTPFEMGLRGIADAMGDLNKMTAKMNFIPPTPALPKWRGWEGGGMAPIYVTVQATVENGVDVYRLANVVAEEIQRRGR